MLIWLPENYTVQWASRDIYFVWTALFHLTSLCVPFVREVTMHRYINEVAKEPQRSKCLKKRPFWKKLKQFDWWLCFKHLSLYKWMIFTRCYFHKSEWNQKNNLLKSDLICKDWCLVSDWKFKGNWQVVTGEVQVVLATVVLILLVQSYMGWPDD